MDISGTRVLVTGAASGIGRASALAFAAAGATSVAVIDLDAPAVEETARLLDEAATPSHFEVADVSDPAALSAAFESSAAAFGGLEIVHNNAGMVSGNPPWPGTPIDTIARVVNVNAVGTMVGTRLGIDILNRAGGGAIVNTASIAGLGPMPNDAVYAATKAAVILFTQSCAELRASHDIRVNAVLPGIVATSMVAKTGDGTDPAQWLQPLLPLMELLDPEAIADVVVELAGDDAKAGQTVIVANDLRPPEESTP